jgi:5-methylcytosine-specific restriction endonuclease McrA
MRKKVCRYRFGKFTQKYVENGGIMTVRSVPKPIKKKKGPKKWTKSDEKKLIKKLEKECKALCSQITRINWKGKCAFCGSDGSASHHFFGWKACSKVRYQLENLVWLCYACHIHKVHQQGLTEPVRVEIIKRVGQDTFDKLYEIAFQRMDWTSEALLLQRERLATILDFMRQNE